MLKPFLCLLLTMFAINLMQARLLASELKLPYLTCQIKNDGTNPSIPRAIKVYLNHEERNFYIVYAISGLSEDTFSIKAEGTLSHERRSKLPSAADFVFSDGTYLSIDFTSGVGVSRSNNLIFRHLSGAELVGCAIY